MSSCSKRKYHTKCTRRVHRKDCKKSKRRVTKKGRDGRLKKRNLKRTRRGTKHRSQSGGAQCHQPASVNKKSGSSAQPINCQAHCNNPKTMEQFRARFGDRFKKRNCVAACQANAAKGISISEPEGYKTDCAASAGEIAGDVAGVVMTGEMTHSAWIPVARAAGRGISKLPGYSNVIGKLTRKWDGETEPAEPENEGGVSDTSPYTNEYRPLETSGSGAIGRTGRRIAQHEVSSQAGEERNIGESGGEDAGEEIGREGEE